MSMWPGFTGLMSMKTTARSFSWTTVAGISLRTILQKMQSVISFILSESGADGQGGEQDDAGGGGAPDDGQFARQEHPGGDRREDRAELQQRARVLRGTMGRVHGGDAGMRRHDGERRGHHEQQEPEDVEEPRDETSLEGFEDQAERERDGAGAPGVDGHLVDDGPCGLHRSSLKRSRSFFGSNGGRRYSTPTRSTRIVAPRSRIFGAETIICTRPCDEARWRRSKVADAVRHPSASTAGGA